MAAALMEVGGGHGDGRGALTREDERERVGEHQWEEGELPRCRVAAVEDRRGDLHGELEAMVPAAL